MSAFSLSNPGRRGSIRPSTNDLLAVRDEEEEKGLRAGPNMDSPSLLKLLRLHMFDWIAVLVMIVLLVLTEMSQPFSKVIYHQTDQELWRLSYPLHTKNTVPAWAVPVLSTCGPALVFTIWYFAAKPSRWEMHSIALGLLANVMACAFVTNVIKLSVGRPRPNFVERCWPDGKLRFDTAGVPLCAANAINPAEGRKSFPSGHTSWTTSGMAYLSFWAAGKLRCFNGGGHPWRLVVSGAPTGLAAWVGFTRLQDYWHHWQDVGAGFLLGLGFAYLFYRQHYPGLLSSQAGEAYVSRLEAGAQPGSPSSRARGSSAALNQLELGYLSSV